MKIKVSQKTLCAFAIILTYHMNVVGGLKENQFVVVNSAIYAGTTVCWRVPGHQSRTKCAAHCVGDNTSVSVWHNVNSEACVMCPTVYGVTSHPNSSSWMYMRKAPPVHGK